MEWAACGGSRSRNLGGAQAEESEGLQGLQTGGPEAKHSWVCCECTGLSGV